VKRAVFLPLLLVVACVAPVADFDCTAEGWDIVGHIGSVPDGCVRVWSVSETMSVSKEGSSCAQALPLRCVVVTRGDWVTVRAKMGSSSHIGMDGYPVHDSAYLRDDGTCPLECSKGLAPEYEP
jgi:hypothetical protein